MIVSGMILQIAADLRRVVRYGDAKVAQKRGRANSRKLQELWRADGAAAHDNLLVRNHALLRAVLSVLNGDGFTAIEFDPCRERAGLDAQVLAPPCRIEEDPRRRLPHALRNRHRVIADADLVAVIEVVIALEAQAFAGDDEILAQ